MPHIGWPDPPWSISGRTVTAWFDIPRAVLEASLPDFLLPEVSSRPWARLRFYDAAFRTLAPAGLHALAPREGCFREAVVAFPACAGGVEGDSTIFMWADSDVYTNWGREVFGWPVLRGEIELEGEVWGQTAVAGATGTAHMREPRGSAALLDIELGEPLDQSAPGGRWLTPRRVLHRAGLDGETVDVVSARPRVIDAGTSYAATGQVVLDFAAAHPLHGLDVSSAKLKVVDGFDLVVGEDVDVLPVRT
jgi:acetoacetate decarboxylase